MDQPAREIRVALEADGDAGKVGVSAEHDFLDRQTPNLRELYHAGM